MKKVRFGLVGTGRITEWILKGALEDERFTAQAVCSRSIEKAREFAVRFDIPLAYDDVDQMASSDEIDAIYIGTPNHTHADIAIRCMRWGKHVICEKPFASNTQQAQEMVRTARENNVIMMEAMISTLNPNFRKAAELIQRVGKIRHYSASFCQYSSKYEALKAGLVAASFDPLCAGGALMDVGVYTIWPMVALFGEPVAVSSTLTTLDITGHGTTDLQGVVQFEYDDFNASVIYSKVTDSYMPTEISGEQGNVLLDKIHICNEVKYIPHAQPTSGRGSMITIEDHTVKDDHDTYYHEFKEFIDCVIAGRESHINSLDRSIQVMRILDQIRSQIF